MEKIEKESDVYRAIEKIYSMWHPKEVSPRKIQEMVDKFLRTPKVL